MGCKSDSHNGERDSFDRVLSKSYLVITQFAGDHKGVIYRGEGSFEDWKSKLNTPPAGCDGYNLKQYTLERTFESDPNYPMADVYLDIHSVRLWDLKLDSGYWRDPVGRRSDVKHLARLAMKMEDIQAIRDLLGE